MRWKFSLILLLFVLPAWAGECVVVSVIDGDTLSAQCDGGVVKVRLYGIDAPEIKQAFGVDSKRFIIDKLRTSSGRVKIEKIGRDRYRRTIGLVVLSDGTELSTALVKSGWAWVYRRYCAREPLCEQLIAYEAAARHGKLGLFAGDNPVEPWRYRRRGKNR